MSDNQEKLNEQLFNVVANSKDSDEARLKKLKYLVYLGAHVNTRLYGKSVLSKAIEKEAGAEVQNFLREKGANEWFIPKEEALELSQGFWDDRSNLKSLEEIKELLKKGADVEASNRYGNTALMVAVYNGHLEVVKYLAECGVDLEVKDGDTALMKAAINGHLDVVKCLAECGADVHQKDRYEQTALVEAATHGHWEVVKCLVELGADLEAQDKNGRTALMKAARDGYLEVVEYLVQNGADLEAKDKYGRTALDTAKYHGRDDCVKFLEEYQKKNLAQKGQSAKMNVSQIAKADEGR